MAKIVNISDKLNSEKPKIVIGEKEYEVNDGMDVVLKFEELSTSGDRDSLMQAMNIALGAKAVKELGIEKWSFGNFKVLITGIAAAVQGVDYEEAAGRFQGK